MNGKQIVFAFMMSILVWIVMPDYLTGAGIVGTWNYAVTFVFALVLVSTSLYIKFE